MSTLESADLVSSFIVALAWAAMGTVLACWLIVQLWRAGHRLIAKLIGAKP